MILQPAELDFLSAWAREEKAVDPYVLPAHRLQALNGIRGVTLIRAIKAWARMERRPEEDIFNLRSDLDPPWPWTSAAESQRRLEEIVSAPATASTSAERSV